MLKIIIDGDGINIKGTLTKEEMITAGKLGEIIDRLCENCKEGAE